MFCFFNDTATTEIYTLSLHDALPIFNRVFCVTEASHAGLLRKQLPRLPRTNIVVEPDRRGTASAVALALVRMRKDRKSTRLNSSHANISYAVFCLKKKKHPMPLLRLS